MWGEIEPAVGTQTNLCEGDNEGESPEKPEKPEKRADGSPIDGEAVRGCESVFTRGLRQEVSDAVSSMVEAVVGSGRPVKSQQIGEAEMSSEERREELLHQYRSKPLVFLERYHMCLTPQHLSAFAHVSSDPRTQHYGRVIQKQDEGQTRRTRVKNQRYAALRALQKEGQYFSEEQMRVREPLLYEHYIGQYLTDEEVLERSQRAMQDDSQEWPEGSGGGTGGLAHLLLNTYQERLIQSRLQEEQEREDDAREENEDDEDEDEVQKKMWEPTSKEKALLREEFISQMHQRFLDGKDEDFNYSEVDGNPDYDNLDIVSTDAEERYFDEDDEEEEEEEENMME